MVISLLTLTTILKLYTLFILLVALMVNSDQLLRTTLTVIIVFYLLAMYVPSKTIRLLGLGVLSSIILVTPLLMEGILGLWSIATIIPIFILTDIYIRGWYVPSKEVLTSIRVTPKGLTLISINLFVYTLSLFSPNTLLTLSNITFTLYIVYILVYGFRSTLPKAFTIKSPSVVSVIAGHIKEFTIHISCRRSVYVRSTRKEPIVTISPREIQLGSIPVRVAIRVKPLLSGPGYASLQVYVCDVRGVIERSIEITRIRLNVIPRARVARQLILGMLTHTTTGTISTEGGGVKPYRAGLEYFSSRLFLPGDNPRFIDWKKTVKLHKLYVKEFTTALEQQPIIALNLTVTSIEEADKLAFLFLTLIYTLTQRGISASLLAYKGSDVKLFIKPRSKIDILRGSLNIIEFIEVNSLASRISDARYLGFREYSIVSRELGEFKKKTIKVKVEKHPLYRIVKQHRSTRLIHLCDRSVLSQVEIYIHNILEKTGVNVELLTTDIIP